MATIKWDERYERNKASQLPSSQRKRYEDKMARLDPPPTSDYISPPPDTTPVARPPRHAPGWYATTHKITNESQMIMGLYWDGQHWLDENLKLFKDSVLCDPSQTYTNGAEALDAARTIFVKDT